MIIQGSNEPIKLKLYSQSCVFSPGVQYYNKVIDDLLSCDVSPMVTLYHFDLPQALQERGGWKASAVAAVFDNYARFCFQTFGDRVKLWLTVNEPYVCAKLGHEDGVHAPGLKEAGTTAYVVAHNMLRAHVLAWHSYNSLYRSKQVRMTKFVGAFEQNS